MDEPRPTPPFAWTSHAFGPALVSGQIGASTPHLFTTRHLVLRGPGSAGGWVMLSRSVDAAPGRLARLKQVHGTGAVIVSAEDELPAEGSESGWPRADIAMTHAPGTAVAVQVADCVPLLLSDRTSGAVAAVHAGWRGAAAGVAARAVDAMRRHFGSRASELVAAIGPSIGPCCYQVGQDVFGAFSEAGFSGAQLRDWFEPDPAPGRYRLDVPRAVRDQLAAAGLRVSNIGSCGLCTACHPSLFYSYRREGPGTGRLAGVIRAGVRAPS